MTPRLRPGRSAVALAAALATVAGATEARGGGIRDLDDGWVAPAGLLHELLAEPALPTSPPPDGAATFASDPGEGGVAPAGRTWARLGVGRLHGLAELPIRGLAVGHARGSLAVEASWHCLGGRLYSEQAWRLRLGWGRDRRLWAGWGRQSLALAGESVEAATDVELGGEMGGRRWRLGVRWPLGPPPVWFGSRGVRPWLSGAVCSGGAILAVALDRRSSGAPVLEVEAVFRLAPVAAIGVRSEPATGALGPTLTLRHGALLLRSSHLVHPELGPTHRWSLGWGRPEGPR